MLPFVSFSHPLFFDKVNLWILNWKLGYIFSRCFWWPATLVRLLDMSSLSRDWFWVVGHVLIWSRTIFARTTIGPNGSLDVRSLSHPELQLVGRRFWFFAPPLLNSWYLGASFAINFVRCSGEWYLRILTIIFSPGLWLLFFFALLSFGCAYMFSPWVFSHISFFLSYLQLSAAVWRGPSTLSLSYLVWPL